uniref:Uncharacterized protein LOC114330670 isoform X2 n=1 Tax=Diabrotica virgifera virgifera TaxID=50390 RepID=A0A6P7FLS6_DIAVI
MKFRIIYLLILVNASASLTQPSPLLDSDPFESLQADDVSEETDPDPVPFPSLACEDDPSLCPKTRAASGIIGGILGIGDLAQTVIKSGVGIFKNIVGIQDPPEVVNVVVPAQQQQVILGPPKVIIG